MDRDIAAHVITALFSSIRKRRIQLNINSFIIILQNGRFSKKLTMTFARNFRRARRRDKTIAISLISLSLTHAPSSLGHGIHANLRFNSFRSEL
jgi:hypothetical protein